MIEGVLLTDDSIKVEGRSGVNPKVELVEGPKQQFDLKKV